MKDLWGSNRDKSWLQGTCSHVWEIRHIDSASIYWGQHVMLCAGFLRHSNEWPLSRSSHENTQVRTNFWKCCYFRIQHLGSLESEREREVSLPGEHTDWCAERMLSLQSFGHQMSELLGKGQLYMTGGRIWVPVFPASGTERVVMHEGRDAQCKVRGGGKGERWCQKRLYSGGNTWMWVSWAIWLENTPGREKRMSTNRGQAKENVKSCPMMKFHRITKSQSLNLYINRGGSQKTMLC